MQTVTEQFADKPTHGQVADWIICGLVRLPKWLTQNLEQNNHYICDIYKFAGDQLTSPRIVQ